MGFEMVKTFEVNGRTYSFTFHPRKTVPFVLPDIHAPRKLSDVYDSYSVYKASAYDDCLRAMQDLDGFGWSICSHNCMYFAVSFYFPDPETGVIYRAHLTRYYWHLYEVEG